jgi:hypothetical protein
LRYRVGFVGKYPRLNFMVPSKLYKAVRPSPKAWRLDVDTISKRGRLSALIQMDGPGCKKHEDRLDEKSLSWSWPWVQEAEEIFPDRKCVTPLHNVNVTSMGIEFDLPKA